MENNYFEKQTEEDQMKEDAPACNAVSVSRKRALVISLLRTVTYAAGV